MQAFQKVAQFGQAPGTDQGKPGPRSKRQAFSSMATENPPIAKGNTVASRFIEPVLVNAQIWR